MDKGLSCQKSVEAADHDLIGESLQDIPSNPRNPVLCRIRRSKYLTITTKILVLWALAATPVAQVQQLSAKCTGCAK